MPQVKYRRRDWQLSNAKMLKKHLTHCFKAFNLEQPPQTASIKILPEAMRFSQFILKAGRWLTSRKRSFFPNFTWSTCLAVSESRKLVLRASLWGRLPTSTRVCPSWNRWLLGLVTRRETTYHTDRANWQTYLRMQLVATARRFSAQTFGQKSVTSRKLSLLWDLHPACGK